MCKDLERLNRIQKEELREWIESGYGCFRVGNEMVDSEYINEESGILDGEISCDSWLFEFEGEFKVVSYL